jgi:hypothetical protein
MIAMQMADKYMVDFPESYMMLPHLELSSFAAVN